MAPPAMATLSWRSRIQAICPRERPSMALPETDAAGSGAGPSWAGRHVNRHGHRETHCDWIKASTCARLIPEPRKIANASAWCM